MGSVTRKNLRSQHTVTDLMTGFLQQSQSECILNGSRVSTRLVAIQNNGATLTSDQRGGQQGGQSLYRDWIAYVWPVSADGSQFAKADVVLAHHQDRDLAIQ